MATEEERRRFGIESDDLITSRHSGDGASVLGSLLGYERSDVRMRISVSGPAVG